MADEKNKKADTPSAEVVQLQGEVKALTELVGDLETKLEALEEAVNEAPTASSVKMPSKPAEKQKPVIPAAKKIGKKSVTFKYPQFRIDGEKVLAVDAVKDAALMERIVKELPGLVTVE